MSAWTVVGDGRGGKGEGRGWWYEEGGGEMEGEEEKGIEEGQNDKKKNGKRIGWKKYKEKEEETENNVREKDERLDN